MTEAAKRKTATYDMVYISVFTVLIAICSWISIPFVVPFTLQTLGIFLTLGILGGKRGTAAVVIYILLGAIGVPVFAGFTSGIGIIMGSTGGYIVGFLFTALIMWGIEQLFGKSRITLAISMVAGLVACYLVGTVWLMLVYAHNAEPVGVWTALTWCVLPFVIPDLLKIALAMYLSERLKKVIKL